MLSVGIVGLPNVGKSTLFNALLKRQIAQVAEYPYTTIEPNVGVVEVPDERLIKISQAAVIGKIVPAAIRFVDIAGLIKGAHRGEGLGNQFLSHIREVDAILHVVRAFDAPNVTHVHDKIDPNYDIEVVNLELAAAGIEKPTIYVLNVAEKDLKSDALIRNSEVIRTKYLVAVVVVCAKLESELLELPTVEQQAYLKELGVEKPALDRVILASYKLLDLTTFFTMAGGRQVQAWPIKTGSKMIEAAGMVHTDMARGFIAAEVIDCKELIACDGWKKAKEQGKVKTIGKTEEIKDGYVVEFRFSV